MGVSQELQLKMYEMMNLVRRFESKSAELFKDGKFPGWIHVCIGQEASVTGAGLALREDDFIAPTHRGHGQWSGEGDGTEDDDGRALRPKDRGLSRTRRFDAPGG